MDKMGSLNQIKNTIIMGSRERREEKTKIKGKE